MLYPPSRKDAYGYMLEMLAETQADLSELLIVKKQRVFEARRRYMDSLQVLKEYFPNISEVDNGLTGVKDYAIKLSDMHISRRDKIMRVKEYLSGRLNSSDSTLSNDMSIKSKELLCLVESILDLEVGRVTALELTLSALGDVDTAYSEELAIDRRIQLTYRRELYFTECIQIVSEDRPGLFDKFYEFHQSDSQLDRIEQRSNETDLGFGIP